MKNIIDSSSVELVVRDDHLEEGIPMNPFVLEAFAYLKGNGLQVHMRPPLDQPESDMAPFFKYGDHEYGVPAMVSDPDTPLIGLLDHWKFEDRRLSDMPREMVLDVARRKQVALASLLPLRNFIFSEYMQTGSDQTVLDDQYVHSIRELSNILGERYSFFEMDRTYISDVEACFITLCIIILKKMDQSVLSRELKRHSAFLALTERFMGTHLKAVAGVLDLSASLDGETAKQLLSFLRRVGTGMDPRNFVYHINFPPGNEYGVPHGVSIVKTFGDDGFNSRQYYNEWYYSVQLKPYGIGPDIIANAHNPDIQFVMMKYYPDGDLSSKVEDTRLTWIEAVRILKRVAYLLYAIHSFLEPENLIYGDFKPENFLLNGDDIIICDLASLCREGEEIKNVSAPYLEDLREGTILRDRTGHPKSDVYKFGKFIIKLVTLIPIEDPISRDMIHNLGEVVSARFSAQGLNDIMRSNMIESGCGETGMRDIIKLALRCLRPRLEGRPTANKVADELAVIEEKAVN